MESWVAELRSEGQALDHHVVIPGELQEGDTILVDGSPRNDAASDVSLDTQLAERRFATDVLSAAAENVTLTETALREGEVSVTDVIVLRTAAVNAQLEYVDILGGVTAAWFQLAAAMNVPPETIAGLLDTEVEQE